MPTDEEWENAKHSIDRHEDAVTEDAKRIAELERQVDLLKEAIILSHELKFRASPQSVVGMNNNARL